MSWQDVMYFVTRAMFGIVRLRTKATEFSLVKVTCNLTLWFKSLMVHHVMTISHNVAPQSQVSLD
jgi:hypothetical protein